MRTVYTNRKEEGEKTKENEQTTGLKQGEKNCFSGYLHIVARRWKCGFWPRQNNDVPLSNGGSTPPRINKCNLLEYPPSSVASCDYLAVYLYKKKPRETTEYRETNPDLLKTAFLRSTRVRTTKQIHALQKQILIENYQHVPCTRTGRQIEQISKEYLSRLRLLTPHHRMESHVFIAACAAPCLSARSPDIRANRQRPSSMVISDYDLIARNSAFVTIN